MEELTKLWSAALPEIRNGVTGVGLWTALNSCQPIALEEDVFVLGIPHSSSDLAGHLRMASTKALMDKVVSKNLGRNVQVKVVEGTELSDWETTKRREIEARKLQEAALQRARVEVAARSSWETVYEQLSRKYASIPNKSLPQNRALYFLEAVDILVEARKTHEITDDLGERNYARCLERVSQYSEVPSVLVAIKVREKFGS